MASSDDTIAKRYGLVDQRKIEDLRATADQYGDLEYIVSELRDVSTLANLAQEHFHNERDERSESAMLNALERMVIVADRLFEQFHSEAA